MITYVVYTHTGMKRPLFFDSLDAAKRHYDYAVEEHPDVFSDLYELHTDEPTPSRRIERYTPEPAPAFRTKETA